MREEPPDFALLDRMIAGDGDALELLMARYRPVALRLSFSRLRSREDAQEIVETA